mmetsp:Transcript_26439/g.36368  ORF Transcript_26439/g.36368 Transcript_26439/m.36368 type:complete len:629 (-) Transcript_26439:305-2191(-)
MRCADEGFDLVRITVQGMREAQACAEIREGLFKKGYDIPLCADMHFQPKVAMRVAEAFEKIRINPGNFADGRKTFKEIIYETDEDYTSEREYLVEAFVPLVEKCKELNRAMRIGVNHGSLSARVLSFYGDTPRGMVESAIEFADIARQNDYHNFVFSMKASNPLVMVQGYRLLAAEQYRLGWDYPLHLGVTEAGEGEDGRMKSAIGIGTLLADGLGDTIRVSLTEDPEYEFEPCNSLAGIGKKVLQPEETAKQKAVASYSDTRDFTAFGRRESDLPEQKPEDAVDYRGLLHRDGSVLSVVTKEMLESPDYLYQALGCKTAVGMPFKDIATADSILMREVPTDAPARLALKRLQDSSVGIVVPVEALEKVPLPNAVALVQLKNAAQPLPECAKRAALIIEGGETPEEIVSAVEALKPVFILFQPLESLSRLHAGRRIFSVLSEKGIRTPVIHHYFTQPSKDGSSSTNEVALTVGASVGPLMIDGLGDGLVLENGETNFNLDFLRTTSFGLLQGCRMRSTKTEFVSCPSCGRTLFDLQEVTAQISERTGHLPGVAIAIMGCIVNGPGEMADADFGYVGGAPGKVDLYVGKEMVLRGIPNEEACDGLIDLIKEHGMWKEKEVEEVLELVAA